MNKSIKAVHSYLLYSFPLVVICMIWGTLQTEKEILSQSSVTRTLWEILAWNLMIWFAVLILFLISIVFSSTVREKTLKRIANLKERDEREQLITGQASRAAYISTLGILIFFLFFSTFQLVILKSPPEAAINGKTGVINIGLHFRLLEKDRAENNFNGSTMFDSKNLMLSTPAILLILIVWQLASFNISARRLSQL